METNKKKGRQCVSTFFDGLSWKHALWGTILRISVQSDKKEVRSVFDRLQRRSCEGERIVSLVVSFKRVIKKYYASNVTFYHYRSVPFRNPAQEKRLKIQPNQQSTKVLTDAIQWILFATLVLLQYIRGAYYLGVPRVEHCKDEAWK